MNILIFSWRGPGHPNAGGAEIVTHEHAKAWVKADHGVTLFTSIFPGAKSEEIIDGVKIIRRGGDIFGVHIAALFWYLFGQHPKFDLVVDEFHGIPFFAPLYVRAKKLGFIHEVAQKVWSFNPWPKPFNLIPAVIGKIGEPLVFKWLYRQVPFMTVSESTKKDLEFFGVKKVTVVYNGVNLPGKLPHVAKDKVFTVIYLSALAKDKGIEDAIKAYKLIKKEIVNSQFWIIGKGESSYIKYLKHLAPKTRFFGYVSELKKYELLAKSHVLIFPSIHEGWGLVIIEAASVGTPTVAYRVSGVKDAVSDKRTGLLSDQPQPQNLANLVIKLVNNPNLYQKMQNECVVWSKKFGWNKSNKLSLKLIENLVFTNQK